MVKVLVVDENETSLLRMKEILKNEFNIKLVISGEHALLYMNKYKPDIVLLDTTEDGSGVDSFQVCKTIRQDKAFDQVWAIFITSKAFHKERLKAYRAGGDDYIVRPFDVDGFILKLKKLSKRIIDYSTIKESLNSKEKKYISLFSNGRFTKLLFEITNNITEIVFVKAEAPYCRFICFDKSNESYYLFRLSIRDVQIYFKNQKLVQIHRSFLVNQKLILSLSKKNKHDYVLKMKKNNTESIDLPVGRSYTNDIQHLMKT